MEQLLLWFNLIAFTLMIGAMGSTYMVYGKLRCPWLGWYLGYQGAYSLFLIILIYRYFSTVYLPEPIGFLNATVSVLRTAIDLLLLWIVPRFVMALIPEKSPRWLSAFCIAGAFLIIATQAAALFTGNWMISWVNKFLYNLYYCLLSAIGILRVRRGGYGKQSGIALVFLYFSVALFFILTVLTLSQLFIAHNDRGIRTSLNIGGIMCFIWGGGALVYLVSRTSTKGTDRAGDLPIQFLEEYSITAREKEIIPLILQGRSNREVADFLCISPRTLEAHIYNIYRKCDIRNKLELSSLVSEYK